MKKARFLLLQIVVWSSAFASYSVPEGAIMLSFGLETHEKEKKIMQRILIAAIPQKCERLYIMQPMCNQRLSDPFFPIFLEEIPLCESVDSIAYKIGSAGFNDTVQQIGHLKLCMPKEWYDKYGDELRKKLIKTTYAVQTRHIWRILKNKEPDLAQYIRSFLPILPILPKTPIPR